LEPLEIRIALMRAGVRQIDIAQKANVSTASVAGVINKKTTSDRLQRMIARAIDQPVNDVFPEKYGRKKVVTPGLERLAG